MLLRILFLGILSFWGCSSETENQNEFMLLAGPLTNNLLKDLSTNHAASQSWVSGVLERDHIFDCSHTLPSQIIDHFQYLQSRGVTHFKVPLSWSHILPTGDPSQPHQDTVRCYRTLLEQLTESGLQPLVVLHRSTVPEGLRTTLGDWESPELPEVFERYAEFVFSQFGNLVKSWITFSQIDELKGDRSVRNVLQAHTSVYQLYHNMFSEKGKNMNACVLSSVLLRYPL